MSRSDPMSYVNCKKACIGLRRASSSRKTSLFASKPRHASPRFTCTSSLAASPVKLRLSQQLSS